MIYQHKIGKISKLRQRSVILLAVLTLVAQPLHGIFASQGANAVSQAPFSVDVTCQDSKAVFNLVTRQAELPGVPQDARNWYATVTYQAGEYGNRVQTLSEKDIDTWTIPTGKYSTDTVGMSARIVGGYTMREDIIAFGQKVGSWDKPYIYTRTLHTESAAKICDTEHPTIEVIAPTLNSVHSDNVAVEIRVTDNGSGLDFVHLNVTPPVGNNFGCAQAGNLDGEHEESLSCTVTISGRDDGEYRIRVGARDMAGNRKDISHAFVIDSTAPSVVSATLNDKAAKLAPLRENCGTTEYNLVSGKFSLGVEVEDATGIDRVRYRVAKANSGGCTQADIYRSSYFNMTNTGGKWIGSEFDFAAELGKDNQPLADGNYTIQVETRDSLGNLGSHRYIDIIVDSTAPTISWQKQPDSTYGVGDGFHVRPITSETGTTKSIYLNSVTPENLIRTLTSDHRNFDTTNAHNQALWDNLSDGQHKFIAVFTDYAGNSTTSESHEFTIDRTSGTDNGEGSGDQPGDLIIDPSPGNLSDGIGGSEISSTSAPAFTAFGLTFNDSGFATGSPIPEGGEDILGAEDDGFGSTFGDGNVLGQTAAAQDANNSPLKAFGVLWYWWLVAFAVFASAWWLIAAKRRKQNDDVRI